MNFNAGSNGLAALLLAPSLVCNATDADKALRNWFDDPFFVVRSAVQGCPVPLGPFTTGDEMRTQTHTRSERGTRCWQEGRCSRPNSYLYDKDIAEGVRARFVARKAFRDASLWVTVQRRIVWIEGCLGAGGSKYRSGRLERLVRDVPDVELVVVNVRKKPGEPAPYRVNSTNPLTDSRTSPGLPRPTPAGASGSTRSH